MDVWRGIGLLEKKAYPSSVNIGGQGHIFGSKIMIFWKLFHPNCIENKRKMESPKMIYRFY